MNQTPTIGADLGTLLHGTPSGETIISVRPYRGKYPQYFRWFVGYVTYRTRSGHMELAV